MAVLDPFHPGMQQIGPDAAGEIQDQEFLGADGLLQRHSEEEERPHIEEEVGEIGVDEHIGEHLPRTEERGFGKEYRQIFDHDIRAAHFRDKREQVDDRVDNQQVQRRGRDIPPNGRPGFVIIRHNRF